MDGAALVDGGGRDQEAVLDDGTAGQGDVALLREHQAGIVDGAAGAAGMDHRRYLVAAGGGEGIGVGAEARPENKVIAGRELGLPLRRGDRAGNFAPRCPSAAQSRRPRSPRPGHWWAIKAPGSTMIWPPDPVKLGR